MKKNFRTVLTGALEFVKTDIWRISLKDLPRKKSALIKPLRVILLAIRGFNEDNCMLRASALTLYSLLSIVPVVAMGFGIAKGFGFEKLLQNQLLERFPGQEAVLTKVMDFAKALLDNTRGGMVAGVGVVLLFWLVIKLLGQIESSFNDIWQIRKARSPVRKFSDYLSIMLIGPVFIVASSSVTIFIKTQVTHIAEGIPMLWVVSPFIIRALKMIPYCLIGVLMTLIYMVMPNTKVNFRSGAIAGMIAGVTYVIVQWGYINFQVGIAKYNAIYGSFAALPLFLVWLQVSWLIVLFGAEISFAIQSVDNYEFAEDCQGISAAFKRLLCLRVAHLLVRAFFRGEPPFTASRISNVLELPIRLVREILHDLSDSGVISAARNEEEQEKAYQPARDIHQLSITSVIKALERKGTANIPVAQTRELDTLSDCLKQFWDAIEASPANRLLKDI